MKMKNLLQVVFVLLVGQLMFSCNSAKYYEFAASKQAPYKVAKQKPAPETTTAEQTSITAIALAATVEEEKQSQAAPLFEASNAPVAAPVRTPKAVNDVVTPENTITETEAIALTKERVKNMTSSEKKALKTELKEVLRQDGRGGASIIEIILAILLPPAAVFLHDGIGTTFWISVLLTLLFYLPGIIYALLIVTDTI